MTRVAVMGSGSWGTAFALVLSDAGQSVTLWARRPELAEAINSEHRNVDYFPTVDLPRSLVAVADPAEAMADAEFVVLAVPSQSLRAQSGDLVDPASRRGGQPGQGHRARHRTADERGHRRDHRDHAGSARGGDRSQSGPGDRRAAAVGERGGQHVEPETADGAAETSATPPRFRAYTNADVIGCELGGATKNVIALAVGMAIGLGLGANATASVITRGLAEITRLGVALGADPYTFSGLAGLGDLVATCSSPLSRNRTLRRGAGARAHGRRDHRLHPAGGRGRQVLCLDPGAGRPGRGGDADRRPCRRRGGRRPDPGGDDHRADVPIGQTRTLLRGDRRGREA